MLRAPVLLVLLLSLVASEGSIGQSLPLAAEFEAPGVSRYNDEIPRPEDVIGHQIGERHTRPDQVVRYFEAVAAASDRVVLGEHGFTHAGRPLIHAIVAPPGRDLEAIRTENLRLSESPEQVSDAALARMPVIAYMGYSVHGDEASGTEAALLLLYHLAAGEGPAIDSVLEHAVVIIDPLLNPDGRARFVDWVNANRGGTADFASLDSQDREHNQPWPRGRTNHYLFDLNRDWLPMQQPESQGRMELWHHWRPQLTTDFHEMGGDATYFFQPGIPSRNNPRTPEQNFELTARLAEYHARALDRIGQLYYTRESFDDFYLGKGSTYPDIQGSVGILFEQASSRALAAETIHGMLDYGTTVRNQFATSLSSLEGAVEMRLDLLRFMRDTYVDAPDFARRSQVKAWVVDASSDPGLGNDFLDMLRRNRIRAHLLDEPVTVDGRRFEPGHRFVVPIDQPQARLTKAVMERVTTFEDSLFYDVSTWPLPLAFGLPYAELDRVPQMGPEGMMPTERSHGRAEVAYVMPWGRAAAPRALYRLQRAGVKARVMRDGFEAAGPGWSESFERGAVIIPIHNEGVDQEEVHSLVNEARVSGLQIFPLNHGLARSGPDLGSPGARVLTAPRVALLSGDGTFPNAVGEVWYLLNERVGMPVSLLDLSAVAAADLQRYDRIIVTGRPMHHIREVEVERLRDWVREGGVLIATGNASVWAAERGLVSIVERNAHRDSSHVPYADVAATRGAHVIGGSVFEVELDRTHPIAFGMREQVAVFKQGAHAFDLNEAPGTNVGVYSDAPLVSGYASPQNQERISSGAAIVAQRHGRGAVVVYDFNPAFRGFWRATEGLLLNAVFFGNAF